MPYTVLAISHADRGEYEIGTFDTPVVAIAVVKMRVDRELAHMLEQGVKATELHEMWATFGTGYAITGGARFSTFEYARQRAAALVTAADRQAWWQQWLPELGGDAERDPTARRWAGR
jgi:hypothetical protein